MDPRVAEVATAKYYESLGYKTRRSVKARFSAVDFFGADVIAKSPYKTIWTQTTTSQTRSGFRSRQKKLESQPWNSLDRVYLFRVKSETNGRKKQFYFESYEYLTLNQEWLQHPHILIQPEWLKARSE